MYLQGGSIVPVGLPYQHVGEADPSDDLTLLIALDEKGPIEQNDLWTKIAQDKIK